MNCKKCGADLPNEAIFCHMCGAKQLASERKPKKRGNGQGSAYKRGRTWEAQYQRYTPIGRIRERKGGFATKKEALDYIASIGTGAAKKHGHTLADFHKAWDESYRPSLSDSKQTAYKIAWEKIKQYPAIVTDIVDVQIENLQEMVDGRTYYPAHDIKVLLSHLYKRACAQGIVLTNLSDYIVLPKLEEAEAQPFTEDEIQKLWKHYGTDRWTGYILLMIYTGMMPGELLKCEKAMIDLPGRQIVGCGLKTKKRKKTPIVLRDLIIPVIQDLMTINDGDMLLGMKKNDFYDRYAEVIKAAGCRPLPAYSCRHTTGTLGADIPPAILKEIMRHTKISTTEKYMHPDTKASLDALNKCGL